MRFNTIDSANGISIQNDGFGIPTKIVIANPGTYNIQLPAQLDEFSGQGNHIFIWLSAEGTLQLEFEIWM